MVRDKRGGKTLREAAGKIGIGPATLMRVENGRIPDVTTFGKICKWLEVDPGNFLGFNKSDTDTSDKAAGMQPGLLVSAHLKADQTPDPDTVRALANMILWAAKS